MRVCRCWLRGCFRLCSFAIRLVDESHSRNGRATNIRHGHSYQFVVGRMEHTKHVTRLPIIRIIWCVTLSLSFCAIPCAHTVSLYGKCVCNDPTQQHLQMNSRAGIKASKFRMKTMKMILVELFERMCCVCMFMHNAHALNSVKHLLHCTLHRIKVKWKRKDGKTIHQTDMKSLGNQWFHTEREKKKENNSEIGRKREGGRSNTDT